MNTPQLMGGNLVTWIPMLEVSKQPFHNRQPRKVGPLLLYMRQDKRVICRCVLAVDITRVVSLKHRKSGTSEEDCQYSQGPRYVSAKVDIHESYDKKDDTGWNGKEREQTAEIPKAWRDVHCRNCPPAVIWRIRNRCRKSSP